MTIWFQNEKIISIKIDDFDENKHYIFNYNKILNDKYFFIKILLI
jgi:hypothetical protein